VWKESSTGVIHTAPKTRVERDALPAQATRPPGGRDAADDILQVARLLVERVLDACDERSAEDDDVMLDVELDGVRCVLVAQHEAAPSPPVALSPREQEIARMVADGYPNKTIAAVLDISSWTVSTHLRRIFAKLGVRTRAAMVARVLEKGLMFDSETGPVALKTRPPSARPRRKA
jgi:DNA-binding CsgD family transcriptional regulator